MEIGQEFEDAEAEEEAALELQRASYKRLDPADYGEEETEDDRGEGAMIGKEKTRKGINKGGGTSAQVATLSAMKSDLEQIALGGAGEVKSLLLTDMFWRNFCGCDERAHAIDFAER